MTATPVTRAAPSSVGGPAGVSPDALHACRLALPAGHPFDPFDLVDASGMILADRERVLVGLGCALTIDLPGGLADDGGVDAAMEQITAITCDDYLSGARSGSAVVAFGALPFDRTAACSLIVPELTYCRERDGSEWVTLVTSQATDSRLRGLLESDGGALLREELRTRADAARTETPTAVTDAAKSSSNDGPIVRPQSSDEAFIGSVASALAAIKRNEVVKVVLARSVEVQMPRDIAVSDLLARWSALEPSCTVFALPVSTGRFVGASPELLVQRCGSKFRSQPLAGTTKRDDDDGGRSYALLKSVKDGEEHQLVVDAIRSQLEPLSAELVVPDGPELVHLHTITHLGTTIEGTLRPLDIETFPSALHLAARLHPTPAVGGVPRHEATELIEQLEPVARGPYAGPVGYVDGAGDGRWLVGIRAMTVSGRSATLSAGVGIVAGSDPSIELLEVNLKLRSVFSALAPGHADQVGIAAN